MTVAQLREVLADREGHLQVGYASDDGGTFNKIESVKLKVVCTGETAEGVDLYDVAIVLSDKFTKIVKPLR